MNFFDTTILHFINGFAHRSWTADYLIWWLQTDGFQKGGIIMLFYWGVWFQQSEKSAANRETLICIAVAAICAIPIARFIAFIAPFRVRPLHVPALHTHLAYTLTEKTLINWSSFPSDHAAFFFTFVAGFFFISRRIGLFVLSYVLLIVCLPRIYLGFHYPTDIIAGAAIGIGVAYLVCIPRVKSAIVQPVLKLMTAHPGPFYVFLFFYTYQAASAFRWVRDVFDIAFHITPNVISKLLY